MDVSTPDRRPQSNHGYIPRPTRCLNPTTVHCHVIIVVLAHDRCTAVSIHPAPDYLVVVRDFLHDRWCDVPVAFEQLTSAHRALAPLSAGGTNR